jgi:hypothetical protein
MRDDYFTASDILSLLNISIARFHKLQQQHGLPAKRIGDRWVCDKPKFFIWFHKIVQTGQMDELFNGLNVDVSKVWAERNEWLTRSAKRAEFDMQAKMNRQYVLRGNV